MIEVTRDGDLTVDLPGLYFESYKNSFYIDRNGLTARVLSGLLRYSHVEIRSKKIDIDISWSH